MKGIKTVKWEVIPNAWIDFLTGAVPEDLKLKYGLEEYEIDAMLKKYDERLRGNENELTVEDARRVWKAINVGAKTSAILAYWQISTEMFSDIVAGKFEAKWACRNCPEERRDFLTAYWSWKAYSDVSLPKMAEFYNVPLSAIERVVQFERGGTYFPKCVREFIAETWDARKEAGSFADLAAQHGLAVATAKLWVDKYAENFRPIDWYGPLDIPPILVNHIEAVKNKEVNPSARTKPVTAGDQALIRAEAIYGVPNVLSAEYWNLTVPQIRACLEETNIYDLRECAGLQRDIEVDFKEALRQKRLDRDKGLSLSELAEKYSLPLSTVSNIVHTVTEYKSPKASVTPELATQIRSEFSPRWTSEDSAVALGRRYGLPRSRALAISRELHKEMAAERQADDERCR